MKISHVLTAAIVIAVLVLLKIVFFPRLLFGLGPGETHMAVRLDPRAAAEVRAWRQAHGLDPAPSSSAIANGRVVRLEHDLGEFASACARSGHRVNMRRSVDELVATCQ